jgi:phosphomannomutase
MALIKSISGIRGTIGGKPGNTLSPLDIVKFTAAYGTWLLQQGMGKKVIVGRDGRISGEMVQRLVVSTLNALGIDVIDIGLTTTPTVEMAVRFEKAAGGIILTASHNPKEWNALKLLNNLGEFISSRDGETVLKLADSENFSFAPVDKLGTYNQNNTALQKHIEAVVNYPLVDVAAITRKKFKIVLDAINSSGAIAVPALLTALGVKEKDITVLNAEVNGVFAHNPEPLPQHLMELCKEVNLKKANLGIAVDPDVDRVCFVN